MHHDIIEYNQGLTGQYSVIAHQLAELIDEHLPDAESKIWHRHPVWFIKGNPITGYSLQKAGLRLMFWSGASFNEPALITSTGKFKDASVFYNHSAEIITDELIRWLQKSKTIQWDYKNIVKRKGKLEPLF